MLSEATSGLNRWAGFTRSSTFMKGLPPVVRFSAASVDCLIRGRKWANPSGVWSGLPVSGSRACRCRIAAPASAAPSAASTISSGVTGRCGDMDGVWIAPVTAQVMMTLLLAAMPSSPAARASAGLSVFRSFVIDQVIIAARRCQARPPRTPSPEET